MSFPRRRESLEPSYADGRPTSCHPERSAAKGRIWATNLSRLPLAGQILRCAQDDKISRIVLHSYPHAAATAWTTLAGEIMSLFKPSLWGATPRHNPSSCVMKRTGRS